jgi:hypothetical protein
VWHSKQGYIRFYLLGECREDLRDKEVRYGRLLFWVVDLDSSEDLFLLILFIFEVNLLLGSDLGTIGCGVKCQYPRWDNNCGYMG